MSAEALREVEEAGRRVEREIEQADEVAVPHADDRILFDPARAADGSFDLRRCRHCGRVVLHYAYSGHLKRCAQAQANEGGGRRDSLGQQHGTENGTGHGAAPERGGGAGGPPPPAGGLQRTSSWGAKGKRKRSGSR